MFTMDQVHRIREMYFVQGITDLAEIARRLGCDWRTVKKYVDKEDFSPDPPEALCNTNHRSKLDPYKKLIDQWLIEDTKAPRKQRHTATRVFKRLKKQTDIPDFSCSYRLVADYVSKKKKELQLGKKEGYIPLNHHPGEAQADFGTADFYENGKLHHEAKYLVMSFPYSNGGYLQLNYGENLECLLEGLRTMFEYIGGVPTEIWFDNTRTIVTEIIYGGGRKVTERFLRFAEHYRFKPVFMNPESGNEKGNVENKVGYLRRNELTPVPRFLKLKDFNTNLLAACDKDMEREHYDKDDIMISELFRNDKKALLPLPSVPFDTALYTSARTDKYGKFTTDKGKHRYSVSPDYPECSVNLKLTSATVTVYDSDMHEIVTHRRLYGEEKESMNWILYLNHIAKKPRSLKNSGIYGMMPENMQKYMDACQSSDRGQVLKLLAELTRRTGFDSALVTVDQALMYQSADPDSLRVLYNRLYSDFPELPPLEAGEGIPKCSRIPENHDLELLDSILQKGGVPRVGC